MIATVNLATSSQVKFHRIPRNLRFQQVQASEHRYLERLAASRIDYDSPPSESPPISLRMRISVTRRENYLGSSRLRSRARVMTIIWWPGKHGFWFWMMLMSSLNPASAQEPGFVSIDCGATSNFTDPSTGIQWTTDAPYISTGTNHVVDRTVMSAVNQDQLQTLRSFPPDRSKHCYTLPATPNTTFLIRATFLHGGFQPTVDNSFSISIDSNIVDGATLTPANIDFTIAVEYVFATDITSDVISFCLLPNGGTNAFINTLELRPLAVSMYDIIHTGRYLKAIIRINNGAGGSDPAIRYPDDPYDRVWYTPEKNLQLPSAQTSRIIPMEKLPDKPPLKVMQRAWINPTEFWFKYTPTAYELGLTQTFYVNFFFAEVQAVTATDVRMFNVILNGDYANIYYENVTIGTPGRQGFNKAFTWPSAGANFSFEIVPGATLGPVLNGIEYYASRVWTVSSTDSRDVNALEVVKTSLGLVTWTGDPCFPVPYSWVTCDKGAVPRVISIKLSNYNLTGTIPDSIAGLTALTDLWLDNNKIQGAIPDLSKLTKLKTLHLQNNLMSGGIPTTLSSLTFLIELFLQNNKFSGPIPADLANRNGLNLQTSGNANLCAPTANCPILPVEVVNTNDTTTGGGGNSSKGGGSSGALIGGIVGGVIAAIIVIILLVLFYCRKPRKPTPSMASITNNAPAPTGASTASNGSAPGAAPVVRQTRAFSLHEVQVATNNYKTKIGEGGFGPVYYGRLPDGTELAVKVNSETSRQGSTEFSTEVSTLSRVHHRNLVSLLGYCEENESQILIYEFMSKGTLREHLYGRDMKGRISWKQRLDIALNAAKGLEYLHNDCIPKIIHRDIKSNNILLNEKLLAKVADFGISKLAPEGDSNSTSGVSTIVRGTTGYLDPEYYAHNKLTQKSDVYSFGVVLLEIICGRPPNSRDYNLVEWARGQLNLNDLDSIIDPFIRGNYNNESIWKVAELAMGCVEPYGVNRPDMNQVVRALSLALEFEEQKTQSFPSKQLPGRGGSYGDYTSTFNTESSYPPTQGSYGSSSEYKPNSGNPPPVFNLQGNFSRLPTDTRSSGDSWSGGPAPV
ncbi:hypothetical protein R1flu_007580 [Riccia fluitans]|uniref:non-specific serine/threonine protein kinase n=1 Tax=Riccia fluitans TaxID=41844 RepID=A0ABD1YZC5_9MARC